MSAIFGKADKELAGLSLATQLPPYARKLNGHSPLYFVQVGDDVVIFSEIDWTL